MKKLTLVVLMASLSGASTSVFAEATSQQSQSYTNGVVDIRIDKTEAMGGLMVGLLVRRVLVIAVRIMVRQSLFLA
ncbi:hypothetical protein [Providencia rettgeri]|uniref:hypothetical protein n=1 Tax=Providencia rettgeri TaxID=587 RepID=UPI0023AAD8BB|nr:hypothetical protein [Providencia rettgeri]